MRKLLYAFIFYSGLVYVFRWMFRRRLGNPVQIFYTHRVIDRDEPLYDFLKILGYPTTDDYERKIAHLSRHYAVTGMNEALAGLRQGTQAPHTVVLTFDDGYRCIYDRVFPLLKKYRLPVTVFLSIDMIEHRILPWHDRLMYIIGKTQKKECELPEVSKHTLYLRTLSEKKEALRQISAVLKRLDNERKEEITSHLAAALGVGEQELHDPDIFLTWAQIMEMRASGLVSFGSHTLTHPILSRVTSKQAKSEITGSKRILEEKLGYPVTLFAYPNGREHDFTQETVEILKEAGYETAVTTIGISNNRHSDLFRLGRHGLMDDPLCISALICAGFFEFLKPIRYATKHGIWERLKEKNVTVWMRGYLSDALTGPLIRGSGNPVHIMLCVVDHFEPQHKNASDEHARQRMDFWRNEYPRRMGHLRDSDGVMPQHTWFYPPHHDHRYLDDILELCKQGCGEIEMHLHHSRMEPFPDTAETLRTKILRCMDDYAKRGGIFCLPDGKRTFAFIHGDWSLDNARGDEFCGVNNELEILQECGCYADFTFPSLGVAQPAMVNRMYYALDDPLKPKSYNRGQPVKTNNTGNTGLMMISGILGPRIGRGNGSFGWTIETSNLDASELPSRRRVDYWVRHAVRLNGKPDWLFIKLHTHGAVDENFSALLGEPALQAYAYMLKRYNDKKNHHLHFVSARQMYNIVKAAEAGMQGNPNEYRDFVIPKYVYLK